MIYNNHFNTVNNPNLEFKLTFKWEKCLCKNARHDIQRAITQCYLLMKIWYLADLDC